jgi:hypothetical protein
MSSLDYDRVAVLDYLKEAIERLRHRALAGSDNLTADILEVADDLARDAAALEAELIEAGYILKPANDR